MKTAFEVSDAFIVMMVEWVVRYGDTPQSYFTLGKKYDWMFLSEAIHRGFLKQTHGNQLFTITPHAKKFIEELEDNRAEHSA